MNLQQILPKLKGVKRNQRGFVAKCPAHQDDHQSLSLSETSDRILLQCFAGCSTEAVIRELGIEWKQLFDTRTRPITRPTNVDGVLILPSSASKIKAVYRYTDETGALLYENVRYEPKDFRQRHFDGRGTPVWNLQGVRRVPYRLPQLLAGLSRGTGVWLCEGEKDADSLAELGFTASSFKNWTGDFNRYIRGLDVVIVRDHDLPGKVQADEAARIVSETAASVRVLDVWADLDIPEKGGRDVSDYIFACVRDEGMTREEIAERLARMAEGLEVWRDPAKPGSRSLFRVKTGNQWLMEAKDRPSPKMLFGELWFEGELCILFADTNVGKSILAVQAGDAISRGRSEGVLTIECGPQKVVYFDFELTDKQFESRLSELVPGSDRYTNHYRFHDENFLRAELDPEAADLGGFDTFEEYLNFSLDRTISDTGAKVLIVDNLTYLRDETENARNALPLMKYLKELKARHGISILALAHTPKRDSSKPLGRNDLQGSKMLINFCDSSFAIGESQKDEGLRYLKQIKARNSAIVYHSENVLLCSVRKTGNFLKFDFLGTGSERDHLKTQNEKEKEKMIAKVRELSAQGMTRSQIAELVGLSKATISRYVNA